MHPAPHRVRYRSRLNAIAAAPVKLQANPAQAAQKLPPYVALRSNLDVLIESSPELDGWSANSHGRKKRLTPPRCCGQLAIRVNVHALDNSRFYAASTRVLCTLWRQRMTCNQPYVWGIASVAALGNLLFGYDWVVIGGVKPFYEACLKTPDASWSLDANSYAPSLSFTTEDTIINCRDDVVVVNIGSSGSSRMKQGVSHQTGARAKFCTLPAATSPHPLPDRRIAASPPNVSQECARRVFVASARYSVRGRRDGV